MQFKSGPRGRWAPAAVSADNQTITTTHCGTWGLHIHAGCELAQVLVQTAVDLYCRLNTFTVWQPGLATEYPESCGDGENSFCQYGCTEGAFGVRTCLL